MKRRWLMPALCLLCAALFAAGCLHVRQREAAAPPGVSTENSRAGYTQQLMERETAAGKIDINSASAETLMLLPGIGEVRAAAIIAYREAHGGFGSVSELLEIEGIGPRILAGFKDYVTVEDMP